MITTAFLSDYAQFANTVLLGKAATVSQTHCETYTRQPTSHRTQEINSKENKMDSNAKAL